MEVVDKFCITGLTMAILPYPGEEDSKCLVYDGHEVYIIKKQASRLLDENMHEFGTNLEGATKAAKHLISRSNVVPVVMSYEENLFWIPTISWRSSHCIWISFAGIVHTVQSRGGCTDILLKYGHRITVNLGLTTLEKRMAEVEAMKRNLLKQQEKRCNRQMEYGETFVLSEKNATDGAG